jgi:hypothetical protein
MQALQTPVYHTLYKYLGISKAGKNAGRSQKLRLNQEKIVKPVRIIKKVTHLLMVYGSFNQC